MIERSFSRGSATAPDANDASQSDRAFVLKVPKPNFRALLSKRVLLAFAGVLIVAGGAFWWVQSRQPTAFDPFTLKLVAASKFPLFFPTSVPKGYRVDGKSVTVPQDGVVVFDLVGPKGSKIYISQEARSPTFNLGGFYKSFSNLNEIGFADGAIATGLINKGATEISSRNTNKTWIIANTNAKVPIGELTSMLKGLSVSN